MFKCSECCFEYKTKVGLVKHKEKHHPKRHICCYCNREFNHKQNRWRHEKICKMNNSEKENNPNEHNNTNNKVINLKQTNHITNHITNNISSVIYVIPFGNEPTNVIPQDNLKTIVEKHGLNSIIEIVKKKHFNPDLPEYQNFCVTGKNDAYANIVDPETRRIKAVNKKDVFDKVYYGIVTNVNTITSTKPEIMETIQRINEIPVSKKMIKKLHLGINEEAYHYKDMVKKTWENAEFTSNENKIKYDLNEWSDDSDDEIPEARRKLIKECSKLLNDIKSKSHLFKKKDIEV